MRGWWRRSGGRRPPENPLPRGLNPFGTLIRRAAARQGIRNVIMRAFLEIRKVVLKYCYIISAPHLRRNMGFIRVNDP